MTTKTYINGLFIKKKTIPFESINVSINVAEFVQQIQLNANDKGYCNIVFQNRKEADKNGNNMYAVLDTFTPTKKDFANASISLKQMDKQFSNNTIEDDLPF